MMLCDTNILIEFYKANPVVIETLQTIGSAHIAVSVITKAELFYGARDKQEFAKIERHLSVCHCYGLNDAVSTGFYSADEALFTQSQRFNTRYADCGNRHSLRT